MAQAVGRLTIVAYALSAWALFAVAPWTADAVLAANTEVARSVTIARSDTDGFVEGGTDAAATAVFTVTVAGPKLTADASIGFTVTGGSGAADYTVTPESPLRIAAGTVTGTIIVTAVNDTVNEAMETVSVMLSDASTIGGITIGDDDTATAVLSDNDAITVNLSGGGRVREGSVATFNITLSGGTHGAAVVVPWTVGADTDTADADDYIAAQTALRFEPGVSEGSVTVNIVDDGVAENAETFAFTVGPIDDARAINVVGSPQVVTIAASVNTVRRVAITGPATVNEGGTANYSVSIIGHRPAADISVTWSVNAGETVAADFGGGNIPTGALLTFTPDNHTTAQTFTIATAEDTTLEDDKTYRVTIAVATTGTGTTSGDGATYATTIVDDDFATVTIARSDTDGFIEGGTDAAATAVFTVTITGADLIAAADIAFNITGADGVADYSFTPTSLLTIAVGNATGTITVTAVDDNINEAAETISVAITAVDTDGDVRIGTANRATADIADNDDLSLSVSITTGEDVFREGGTRPDDRGERFVFTISGATLSAPVQITYNVSGDVEENDYSVDRASPLMIAVGETGVPINFTAIDDRLNEATETLRVTITGASTAGVITIGTASDDVELEDNDKLILTLDADPNEAEEGGRIAFTVTVSGAMHSEELTVPWTLHGAAVVSADAVAADDYTVVGASPLKIPRGATRGVVNVDIMLDGVSEDRERMVFTIGDVTGGNIGAFQVIGSPHPAFIGTSNNRTGFDIDGPVLVAEGATATYSVIGSGTKPAINVRVTWSVSGADVADFSGGVLPAGGTLIFTPDNYTTEQTFTVTTAQDNLLEADEEFAITLDVSEAIMGDDPAEGDGAMHGTVISDDDAATVAIVRSDSDGFTEGGATTAGTAVFTVTVADATLTTAADIAFTVTGADGASDYTVVPADGMLSITGTTGTITVTAVDDNINEASETVTVTLTDADTSGTIAIDTDNDDATADITDDDAITVTVVGGGNVSEGGSITFTVTLSDGTHDSEVTVPWTLGATVATDDDDAETVDYSTAVQTPLRFAVGDIMESVTVNIVDDGVAEGAEKFAFTIGSVTAAGLVNVNGSPQSVTIAASTGATRTVDITGPPMVGEGDVTTYNISVSGDPPTENINVTWSVTAGETAAADFDGGLPADATLIFTPDNYAIAQTFTIATADDSLLEEDETFTVAIAVQTTGGGTTNGNGATQDTAIIDNDTATVTIARSDRDGFIEGGVGSVGTAVFTVTVSGATLSAPADIAFTVTGGNGASDYTFTPTPTLSITAVTGIITVTAVDDALNEATETVTVTLTDASTTGAINIGDDKSDTVSLSDNDAITYHISGGGDVDEVDGAIASFTVHLSGASAAAVTVPIEISGTAESSDYTAPAPVMVAAGDTSKNFTIALVNDRVNETAETIIVTVGAPPTVGAAGGRVRRTATAAQRSATATIGASDPITYTIGADSGVTESATTANIAVTLSGAADGSEGGAVNVPFSVDTASTALDPDDYTVATSPLSFAGGDGVMNIVVTIKDDELSEQSETVIINLGMPTSGAGAGTFIAGTDTDATATITDDDDITVTIARKADESGAINEGDDANFTITLSKTPTAEVTVPFTIIGDATAPSPLTIASLTTSGDITVTSDEDTKLESGETVMIVLGTVSGGGGGGISGSGEVTVDITDDDTATVTVERTDTDAFTEGGIGTAGTAVFTVTVTGAELTDAASVTFTVTVTGGSGTSDYTFAPADGMLSITDTTGTITVTAEDDALNEATETVTVTLTGATTTGAINIGDDKSDTASLSDNDAITYRISGGGDVNEADGAVASFTVHLSGASAAEVTVPIEISGTAESSDYTAPATVAVAAGSVVQNFDIALVNDMVNEAAETVIVTVGTTPTVATGGGAVTRTATVAQQSATATIGASDPITYAIGTDMEVAEVAATVNIAVTLSGAAGGSEGGAVNVPFTVDTASTAADPADYTVTASPLAFTGGNGAMNITVTVKADTLSEQNETVILNLGTPTSGAGGGNFIAGADISATVTITDDDAITVTIARKSGESGAINEGDSATFTVTLSKTPTADVTVPFILSGEATATSPLTITKPATSGDITVTSTEDTRLESGETVMITLGTVSGGGGIISGSGEVTVGITDNDAATVTIARTDSDGFTEGGSGVAGTAVFTVTVADATLTTAADIAFTVTGAGGASDYTFSPASPLSIAVGTVSDIITVTAVNDNINEASETIAVTITGVTTTGMADIGATADADADIADDDPITVTVSGGGNVSEGGNITFTVALSGGTHDSEVTVPWTLGATDATDDDDAEAADYSTAAQTPLRFAVGDSMESVTVNITDDGVAEVAEKLAFTVGSVSTVGAHTVVGSPQVATIAASVNTVRTVAITGPATVAEGDATTDYSVSITGHKPTADISVTWSVTAGDTVAADFDGGLPVGAVLTFTPDNYLTAQTFTITTAEDTLLEGGETFTVTIAVATAGTGTTNGNGATHDTAITDDDTATVTVARTDTDAFTEGGSGTAGTAVFTVTVADATLTTAADIAFTVTGADDADDYTVAPTSPLSITGTTGTITVTAVNDALNEATETVTVTLTGATTTGAINIGDDKSDTASLGDNDTITATLSGGGDVVEGDDAEVTVTLTGATLTAAAVLDYTVTGAITDSGTFTIETTDSAPHSFSINTVENTLNEADKMFTVNATATSAGTVTVAAAQTFTITDDDDITYRISGGGDVNESDGAVASFTVHLSGASAAEVTVPIEISGTAESSDYTAPATVAVAAGAVMHNFTIVLVNDTVNEAAETVIVTVGAMPTVATGGGSVTRTVTAAEQSATATIGASDPITYAIGADAGVAEGAATVSIAVTLSGAAGGSEGGAVNVPFTVDTASTAADPADYTVTASPLAFTGGNGAMNITVTVKADTLSEQNETIILNLGTPTSGAGVGDFIAGADISATVTIVDDDTASVTVVRTDTDGFTEGGSGVAGTAVFTITVADATLTTAADIAFTVTGADGVSDYTFSPASPLSIAVGTVSDIITVTAVDNNTNEATETVTVTITGVITTSMANIGATDEATADIADDDAITVTVAGGGNVSEGGSVTFTVTLSGGMHDSEVTVPWALGATVDSGDDDAEAVDYSTAAQTPLRFAVGDIRDSVTVNIIDDGVEEVAEKFAFTVGSVSTVGAHTVVGSPQVATIAASVNTVRTVAITGPATVAEGDATTNYSVAVTGHRPTADISVTWSVTAGDTVAADFDGGLPAGAVLTFTPDNYLTAQTFTITTAEDMLLEGGETFTVAITVATSSTGTTNGDSDTHDTAITDDDTATVTVARTDTDAFTEGGVGTVGTAVFTVTVADATLTTAADIAFTVTGANGADDYTVAPTSPLSLTGTTGTITVTAVDDNINEASETVTVTLTAADTSGTINIGSTAEATAAITDDDAITVTVATAATSANEGDSVTFTVTLSKASDAVVVVPYTVSGVSVGDVALTSLTGTVNVAVGQTEGALTFDITRDASAEDAETLKVDLDASGYMPAGRGIARGSPASAMLTINASAATVRRLTISGPSTISETDAAVESGTYTVAIAEGDAFTAETAVTWTVSGVDDADFAAASDRSGSVTFAAGSKTAQTFTVTVAGDNLNEGDESFSVALGVTDATTDGGTAFGDAFETTITDDDAITATLGGGGDVDEGDDAEVTVTLSGEMLTAAVVLEYSVTGAITASGVFTIATTDSAPHSFLLSTAENALNEADKMFTVNATASSAGTVTVAAAQTFTITDDDDITYRISGGGDVNESDGAVASFTVHLSGASAAMVTVPIEISGTAESSDYTAPATVVVAAGSVMQNFTIAIVNDTVNEAAETVIATVGATPTVATGGGSVARTVTAAEQSATATIGASDPITYAIGADMEVAEGAATVNIAVTLSGAAGGSEGGAVNVPFTVDTVSTAADPADYTVTASPLSFANGNGEMNITVTVKADTLSEQNETVILNLGTPTGGVGGGNFIAGADISATVTITDDDAITVTIARKSGESGAINEGDSATFTVTLSKTPTADVTVPFILSGEATATSPLTITAPATSGDITVTSTEDTRLESGETVMITLGTVSGGGGIISGSGEVTVGITDNDAATVTIARTDSDGFTEGGSGVAGTAVFTVTVADATLTTAADIAFTVTGAGGASDYTFSPASPLSIAADTVSDTITVTAMNDNINEASETVTVTITGVTTTGMADIGAAGAATADIADDDAITVTVSGGGNVSEGGNITFTVALSGGTHDSEVTVPWTLGATVAADDDDAEAVDYSTAAQTPLRFAVGDTMESVTVNIVDDGVAEVAEKFAFTVGSVSTVGAHTVVGSPQVATIAASVNTVRTVAITGPTTVAEGDATTDYSVAITGHRPTADISVTWSVTAGDTVAADFDGGLPAGAMLIFTPDNYLTAQTFTITTAEDTMLEASETFTVAIAVATSSTGTTNGNGATHDTAITDDDTATVTVARTDTDAFTEGGSGTAGTAVFTVTVADATLTAAADIAFTVTGADGADDYTVAPASPLSITGATGTLTVTAVDDDINEASETITVTITAADTTGTIVIDTDNDDATADITDDDAIAVTVATTVATTATTVDEGDSVTFTVTLSKASDAVVVVPYTVSGVTVGDVSLTSLTGMLSVVAGQTEGMLMFDITRDALAEDAEMLTVDLDASGYTPGDRGIARGAPFRVTLQIPANAASVRDFSVSVDEVATVEGNTLVFTVDLVGEMPTAEARVNFAIGGTVEESDYRIIGGEQSLLRFAALGNHRLRVEILRDNLNESAETLTLTLSDAVGGGGGGTGIAVVSASTTIAASDPITYAISGDQNVTEGDAGSQMRSFSVTLSGASAGSEAGAVRVPFTFSGSATVNEDFTITESPLNFVNGNGVMNIGIGVNSNLRYGPARTVIINIQTPTTAAGAGAFIPDDTSATLTIVDDDALRVSIERTDSDGFAEGAAGTAGTAVFTVTVGNGTSTAAMTVNFTVSGAAITVGDYIATPAARLTIAAGVGSGIITVTAVDDDLGEAAETLTLRLTDASGGGGGVAPVIGTAEAQAVIAADGLATMTLARVGDSEVDEGTAVTFRLRLSERNAADVTVAWRAMMAAQTNTDSEGARMVNNADAPEFRDGDADGLGVGGSVRIAARNMETEFVVTSNHDGREEDAETVVVTLGAITVGAGGGMVAADTTTARVTVRENEATLRDESILAEQMKAAVAVTGRAMALVSTSVIRNRMLHRRSGQRALSLAGQRVVAADETARAEAEGAWATDPARRAAVSRSGRESGEAVDGSSLVRGTAFVLPFGNPSWHDGDASLWGAGGASSGEGKIKLSQGSLSYEDDAMAFHLGADREWADGSVLGISVGYTVGDVNSEETIGGIEIKNRTESRMTSVHPYMLRQLSRRTQGWLVLGYGTGSAKVTETQFASVRRADSNLTVAMAGFGAAWVAGGFCGSNFSMRVDSVLSRGELERGVFDDGSVLPGVTVDTLQLGMETEFGYAWCGNSSARMFVTAGARDDFDDTENDSNAAADFGGGFEWVGASGLSLRLRGAKQVSGDNDASNWGAEVNWSGRNRRLSFAPYAQLLSAGVGGAAWSGGMRFGGERMKLRLGLEFDAGGVNYRNLLQGDVRF